MKEKNQKDNRFQESRYYETRSYDEMDDEIRRNILHAWRDPFYVNPELIPPGMIWEYKRQYLDKFGYEDKTRISECMRKGWRPVAAERVPELASLDVTGKVKNINGFIETGGQILMERPKSYHELELEMINRNTFEQLHSNEALRGHSDFVNVNRNSINYGPMTY